jgi:hypothetical protein
MAQTGNCEYGIFVLAGAGQGSMEYGVFVAAGLLGQEHRMWARIGGEWKQVIKAYQKVAGAWQPVTVRQKVAGEWIAVVT